MSLNHPAKDQLIAFGQGRLAADESSHVEQHLEVCRECCETLLDLKDDTFVGLVKIAQSSDSDRRMGTPARPDLEIGKTEADKAGTGNPPKADHPTDVATLLVQSGEAVRVDELPAELRDHPRYRIVELIGRGGMGNVYRAEHRLMNRPVAIKLINSQLIRQPNAVERFRREVQAAAKLTHPNIVTAYDAEQAGDVHFLVMEFVEGTDLASVVKHRGPMSVAEACECIRQAAEGLQHAHEKGMVHRDIKPHNLMLSAEGQVRILDFGLAGFAEAAFDSSPVAPRQESRMSDDAELRDQHSDTDPATTRDRLSCRGATGLHSHLTTAGSVMGTPDYIAPEQAKDAHSADIRADIYSLGCTLHFLLTGKPPFVADNVLAKLKAHAQETPPSLATLRNDVPTELQRVVAKMMAKTPAERFQTPAEVSAAIAPFSKSAQVLPRRRTLRTMLVAAAVILLAGVIFITTDKGRVEIRSERDDVELVIRQNGAEIKAIDLQTGTQVTWLPSGEYNVVLRDGNDYINLEKSGFKLSRWGKEIVTVKREAAVQEAADAPVGKAAATAKLAESAGQAMASFRDFATVTAYLNHPSNNRGGSVPVALLGQNGRVAFRFGTWLVVFEGIVCDPKLGVLGFSSFNIPHRGSSGEGTIDFGAGDKLPGVLIKFKFANEQNEISINNHRFKLRGKATKLEFDDKAYDATNSLQTILVARDGSTRLQAVPVSADAIVEVGRFKGHEGPAYHAIVSPGGRFGISCGWDKTIRMWDLATQEEKRVLKGHEGYVFGLAISRDGKLLASSDNAKSIRMWNLETGEQVGELTGHTEAVTDLAFMPDRTHLLSAGFDDTLRLWHVADRKLVRTIDIGTKVEKMIPLPDGRRVMLSGAHTRGWGPRIYDLEKGDKIDATPNAGSCMAVTTDGRMLLIGSITGVLRVTDADKGNLIVQMTDPRANVARDASARDAAITPDGRFAITTTRENQMHLWDLHGGKLLSTVEADTIGTVSLSPDGRYALTIGRQGGIGVWRLPESVLEPIAAVRVNPNLLTDPSFENTGLTLLPRDWRAWTNEDSDFRCEVVNGAHTGQRSLRISGKGIRGVVFGNDIKADRTKRYALKGWAKFEGDKDARAIIKFNYFRGSEYLGVHDLVGVTADQPGWHLLEKTDTLDAYPQADHFYVMCHVEGSGSGWFDDLELLAYDRNKLPADFDSRHGRHNRLTGPNSLDRWVGAWETQYAFRETDYSPNETKLTMNTASERTLGDYFLLSHAKAVPVAPKDRKPPLADPQENALALGGEERLLFLTFDQNLGAFRQWFFSSNGKAFEWRGPWDDTAKSLELRMLPDASNLFSSERFVDADHIEAKLRFQYVMGMKDAGRWTAARKAATAKVVVPAAKSRAAEPAELSQLDKFAGEWTIRARYKPSVWNPLPREETIRETSVWILGGRFLMTRAFNEKDELTSIWIATYEPREKSNRFWFFNADGSSGEWRLTWDEPSSGFHFRAVDLPTGWSGTGFNRWVNEDSFDNQALIKDENGRVLLDSTQDKRRKK